MGLACMSSKAFEFVLDFIYTGTLVLPVDVASEVLHAADVLILPELHALCEELLTQYMDVETVVDLMSIADSYGCQRLLHRTLDFAREHHVALKHHLVTPL